MTLLTDKKILLNRELFTEDVVLSTAAMFTNEYYINIDLAPDNQIEITITSKSDAEMSADIGHIFYNELINEQVKYNLQRQFGNLRDIIVEQAFSPIKNK